MVPRERRRRAVVAPLPAPGTTVAVTDRCERTVPRSRSLSVAIWRSSTSTTTSDFALSFTSMSRSATATLSAVSRMTIAFSCGIVPRRLQVEDRPHHGRDVLHVAVRQEERPDDEVLVLLAVLLRVLRDEDRLLVDDLVEVAGLPHRRLEGLLERHPAQVEREAVVLELRVVDDVDARRGPQRRVDLLDVRVGRERDVDRLRRRRVQHRRRPAGAARPRLRLLDGSPARVLAARASRCRPWPCRSSWSAESFVGVERDRDSSSSETARSSWPADL